MRQKRSSSTSALMQAVQARLARQLAADLHRDILEALTERLNNLEELGLEEVPNRLELAEPAVLMLVGRPEPLEAGPPREDGTGEAKDEEAGAVEEGLRAPGRQLAHPDNNTDPPSDKDNPAAGSSLRLELDEAKQRQRDKDEALAGKEAGAAQRFGPECPGQNQGGGHQQQLLVPRSGSRGRTDGP